MTRPLTVVLLALVLAGLGAGCAPAARPEHDAAHLWVVTFQSGERDTVASEFVTNERNTWIVGGIRAHHRDVRSIEHLKACPNIEHRRVEP